MLGISNQTGDFMDIAGVSQAAEEVTHHEYDPEATYTDPHAGPRWEEVSDEDSSADNSFLSVALDNFIDSILDSGVASVAKVLWGNIAHTSLTDFFQPQHFSTSDTDYVKNALPDDEEGQQWALSHARDREALEWFVNQRLAEKKRRQDIAQWRAGSQSMLEKGLVALAGGAGLLTDPLYFIPLGAAGTSIRMLTRLGDGIRNVAKARMVAEEAAKVGLANTAVTMANDYMRDKAGGQKVNYGFDAATAFLAGTALGATGGMLSAFRRGGRALDNANALDSVETQAYEHAADIPTSKVKVAEHETYDSAFKYHDANYSNLVKSSLYNKLVEGKRLIAAPSNAIRQLVMDTSGIDIPETARALYVPNEDYAIIFTDKVKPQEIEPTILHELGVHGGLQKLMGDKAYQRLLTKVDTEASHEGSALYEARQLADTYDPEEILAKAIETNRLDDTTYGQIKQAVNKVLRKNEASQQLNTKQVKDLIREAVEVRRMPTDYHVNADGSTAFAGLRFSEDNIANPENFARFFQLEQTVTQATQQDILSHFPQWLADPVRKITKLAEQGIYGLGINSASNTMRHITAQLWQDARGRGLGYNGLLAMTAEENKQRMVNILFDRYRTYADIRWDWCKKNHHIGRAGQAMFDKMVINAYNAKFAKNTANVIQDLPEEVRKAIDAYHNLRLSMVEMGQTSGKAVGKAATDLIDPDWFPVDEEMFRRIDNGQLMKFAAHFNSSEDMYAFLEQYIKDAITPYKREIIRKQLQRPLTMENAKRTRYNDNLPAGEKPKKLLDETITDEALDSYIEQRIPEVARGWTTGTFDISDPRSLSTLGNLDFMKARLPMDTTHIAKLPDGTDFSFDNNLRSYDLDNITLKSISRLAGEASLKAVIGTQKELDEMLAKVQGELTMAVTRHAIDQSTAKNEYKALERSIAELRGTRSRDDSGLTKLGAIAHILRNLAYAKNGANMGFNQMAEAAGTIAYGGAKQLAYIIPPLGRFIEQASLGKLSAQTLRDAEQYAFGSTLESQIFNMNWGDRVVRDNLTADSLINRGLTLVADATANLGKVTSATNFLPKMTDSMIRGMRVKAMLDTIRLAHGEQVETLIRKPFSPAKLKASGITTGDWTTIQKQIKQYSTIKDGNITAFDLEAWQREDPYHYAQWYSYINTQAERAIVSATKQGNKNLLKSSNSFWQLFFQFKDYNLRSINAQTLRAMTAGDIDDAMAAGLSIATNTAVYAARAALTVAALKAAGADEKAKKYADTMFSNDTLARAAATRSTMIGSPLSFGNDIYEAMAGAPTVRTTIQRNNKRQRERDFSDMLGDAIGQLPGIREAEYYTLDTYRAFSHMANDKLTKRDVSNLLHTLPFPNLIPFYAYTQNLVEQAPLRR